MRTVSEQLVCILGGLVTGNRMTCDYNVYFINDKLVGIMSHASFKSVHFKYITESFFSWIRLNDVDFFIPANR